MSPSQKNSLSTPTLSDVISGFFTLRSTVKELSLSLQRLENIMDNAYRMFDLANTVLSRKQPPRRRPPLRLVKPNREEEDIPRLNLPPEEGTEGAPLGKLFESLDLSQILKLIQSPAAQQLMNGLLKSQTSSDHSRQKQG
ncbi:hypothetical protein [Paludifilum halophilum]|uniref:hypothetical protein n=1 Tax=Paludifilum halophilum TaxID=1642702 RepID=UPI0011401A15|nr:hypothetical protein [Paludifilum halophilum]